MKIIKKISGMIDQLYNDMIFKVRRPECETKPIINGKIYMVSKKGAIHFGKNVRINSSLQSNPIGGSCRTILFAGKDASIRIGDHTGISNSAIFAADRIEIGSDVMIGGDCKIYDTDFHSVEYDLRMEQPDTNIKTAPVIIEDGAFIGASCIILKGVRIGKHSVVGAGSVVTKSIPANEVWAGNPAKFIKTLSE